MAGARGQLDDENSVLKGLRADCRWVVAFVPPKGTRMVFLIPLLRCLSRNKTERILFWFEAKEHRFDVQPAYSTPRVRWRRRVAASEG